MSEQLPLWGRRSGNRQASRHLLLAIRKEGGSRGKHGFRRGSEAQRSDERGVFA